MKIKVLQEDIEHGRQHHPNCCPIALATKRASYDANYVIVGTDWLIVENRLFISRYELPECAKAFVQRFDEGKFVMPFEFEIVEQ